MSEVKTFVHGFRKFSENASKVIMHKLDIETPVMCVSPDKKVVALGS